MKNLWTIAAVLLTALTACSKDNAIHTWEGKVLEYGTMKAVPNATLYLQTISGSILGPGISKTIDSTISDHNGYFKFTFLDEPYSYRIRGSAEQYFQNDVSRIQNNKNTNKDLVLDPFAWLKVYIKNTSPIDQNDFFSWGLNSAVSCSKGFSGMNIDTFHFCENRGNREHNTKYAVTKAGLGRKEFTVNYFLGSRDTTEIFIEY